MNYNYKNKNCVVTGGSGFIGQHLVKKLLDQGAEVLVIDNFSYGAREDDVDLRAEILKGDVRDRSLFQKLPQKNWDYFFHFGAPSSVNAFKDNSKECTDITVGGFINALDFCKAHNTRLVYPSSGKVYMGLRPPHKEDLELNYGEMDDYAKAKAEIEGIHKENADRVSAVGLRILAGYGPGEEHKGASASVPYLFSKAMLKGKRPTIFGDGTQSRDFVYIEDVTEAILTLGEKSEDLIVNVSSGKKHSFNEVVEAINKILGTDVKPQYVEKPKFYAEETVGDITILKKYYVPKYSLEEGLKRLLEFLKNL